jgi:carboxyl-terminal processing protease
VAPDIEVQEMEIADITRVPFQKAFDYATRYRAEHASIVPARQSADRCRLPEVRGFLQGKTSATALIEKAPPTLALR